MANLSVSLSNLLKGLSYHYAMASKQNAANQSSASNVNVNTNTTSSTQSVSKPVEENKNTVDNLYVSNQPTNNIITTTTTTTTNKTVITTNNNASLSNLSKLLSKLSKKTSVLDNTSVITNDMKTEFFKSYKNAIMTGIYNKLQNGSALTETDLANFKSQVAKISTEEQKLWKTEIAQIQAQIESKIVKTEQNSNNSSNAGSNNGNANSNAQPQPQPVLNGFVSGVLYQNGTKFTGTYTDGKYYVNGAVANGLVAGKLYQAGVLANTTVNGKLYQNGVLANGTINGKVYQNGVEVVQTKPVEETKPVVETKPSTETKIVTKKTNSNGDILGYDAKGNLVYLEKTINGKKVVYTDELAYLNQKTKTYLTQVADATLTDRVLEDIRIVKNAKESALKVAEEGTEAYEKAYTEALKSQMIKTTQTAKNVAGELVEKNGKLYVNDGEKLVGLNISAETYLELFPPVDRYDINQNSIGDCYFVSGCLTDMMKNEKAYAQLLQMFSEDANGNITVKFAGSLGSYPVTFEKGELKVLDGKVDGKSVSKYTNATGSKGTQMLEQAYSIASFAKESGEKVSAIDIDETISTIKGGWQYNVYSEVLGMDSTRPVVSAKTIEKYLDSMANSVNNGETILSFASYGSISEYNLTTKHAYSIESIDAENNLVYITNPWFSGGTIAVPYDVFAQTAYEKNDKVYFNVGYVC